MTLLMKGIRNLFGAIDEAVYGIISSVYDLLINIASQEVFKSGTIDAFADRIYALIGIFMLFKLAFSLVGYIVNPDEFKDSKKGGKKLIVNVMVVVVLITVTPTIFEQSRNLQSIILEEDVIGNLILGISGENNDNDNQTEDDGQLDSDDEGKCYQKEFGHGNGTTITVCDSNDLVNKTAGDQIAMSVFKAFYYPNTKTGICSDAIIKVKNDNKNTKKDSDIVFETSHVTEECENGFSTPGVAHTYVKGMAFNDIETILFKNDVINDQVTTTDGKKFSMKYMILISTAAGIVVLLIFVNFCIEVAVRAIKLGFLELIAPIPIISYIDPKSAESGLFSKWVKMCVSTYISLFIRLAAIYFAIFIIGEIVNGGIDLIASPLVTVFLILGALIFAGQVPKMIEELVPSLKGAGTFSLNPMKTIGSSPLAAAAVGGLAGAAGGIAANTASKIHNLNKLRKSEYGGDWKKALTGGEGFNAKGIKKIGKGLGSGLLSAAGGGLAAGYGAGRAGLGGKGSILANAGQAITRSSNMRNFNAQKGGAIAGLKSRATDKLTDMAGIKYSSGSTSQIKSDIQVKQHQLQNLQAQEQAGRQAVQDLIREQDAQLQTELRNYFNYSATYDEKGNYTYDDKSYTGYVGSVLNERGICSEADWNSLSDQDRWDKINDARTQGIILDDNDFKAIHSAYDTVTRSDMASVTIKKEITQLEEQRDIKNTITPKN